MVKMGGEGRPANLCLLAIIGGGRDFRASDRCKHHTVPLIELGLRAEGFRGEHEV